MVRLLVALLAVAAGMWALAGQAAPASPEEVVLRYDPPLGQVARYRFRLYVSGTQTSLGETLPVRWQAEGKWQEEVVAKQADGSFCLRVTARPVTVSDANGAFANGLGAALPALLVCVSPTGAVIETTPTAGPDRGALSEERPAKTQERSLASFIMQLSPVLLPDGPVSPGSTWTVETAAGGRQSNRLLSVERAGDSQIARISSSSRSPLALEEGVAELGLATRLSGEAQGVSELEMAVRSGLVRHHQGRSRLVTRSQVSLSVPEVPEAFLMEGDLVVSFDLRLEALDGKAVSPR